MSLFPSAAPKFDAALRDVDASRPESRERAAKVLGRAPEERVAEAIAALVKLGEQEDRRSKRAAFEALGELDLEGAEGRDAALKLLRVGIGGEDEMAAELALRSFVRHAGAEAESLVRHRLKDSRPRVRFQAVDLAQVALPRKDAIAAIELALKDEDAEVVRVAIGALDAMDAEGSKDTIAKLLKHDVEFVRFDAACGLARLGDKRGVEILLDALRNKGLAFHAAECLGHLEEERAVPGLSKLAGGFFVPKETRAVAIVALAAIGQPGAKDRVKDNLRSKSLPTQVSSIYAVGELGMVDLLPDLARSANRLKGPALSAAIHVLSVHQDEPELRPVLDELGIELERPD